MSPLSTALAVLRREGALSAWARGRDRLAEAGRARTFLPLRGESFEAPLLNVLGTPPTPHLGGVQTQLLARLGVEIEERPLALLYPGGRGFRLELQKGPARRARVFDAVPSRPPSLEDAGLARTLSAVLRITGHAALHCEGLHGLPLATLARESPSELILSVHDFSLFCTRSDLLEVPAGRFCGYSTDRERCGRCLRDGWDLPPDFQDRYRSAARTLLTRARAVVYPSIFLKEAYEALFHLRGGRVIPPGVPHGPSRPRNGALRHVAFLGGLKAAKGARVFGEIIRALGKEPRVRLSAFGGGDPRLLGDLQGTVRLGGYYRSGSLGRLLVGQEVDLALLLSITPESYSLTLDECLSAGVPVIAFDHGAIAERLRRAGGGILVPLESGVRGILEALEAARRRLPEVPAGLPGTLPSPRSSAGAYLALYRELGWLGLAGSREK